MAWYPAGNPHVDPERGLPGGRKIRGADQGLRATVRADFVNPCGECQVFFILGSWRGAGSWAAALELASRTVKVDDNRQQG